LAYRRVLRDQISCVPLNLGQSGIDPSRSDLRNPHRSRRRGRLPADLVPPQPGL